MSRQSAASGDGPPEVVYIIRHGEKPDDITGGRLCPLPGPRTAAGHRPSPRP